MKKFSLIAFCLVLTLASLTYAQVSETEKPTVVKAVAPTFIPAAALALKVEGNIQLLVEINQKGAVESTKSLSGHKLLRGVAEKAAAQWLFNADNEGKKSRHITLTFIFHQVTIEKEATTLYLPPYQVELFYHPLELVNLTNTDPASTPLKKKQIKVLKYEAPKFPAIARAVRIQDEAIVNIKIDKDGNVTEATAESGHLSLRKSAEDAAMNWIFSPDKDIEEREVKITFAFHIQNNRNTKNNYSETKYKIKFLKPYRLEIVAII